MKYFLSILISCHILFISSYPYSWSHGSSVVVTPIYCAPEVQKNTLDRTLGSVQVLLNSDIFEDQIELREQFSRLSEVSDMNEKTLALLALVGVHPQNPEEAGTEFSRFMGARNYNSYLLELEENTDVKLTVEQKKEFIYIFENLRGHIIL